MFVVLTSATNGYDGSLMNGLQAMPSWKRKFDAPSPAQRGLLNAIFPVGSIIALPVVPYIADILGRRIGVMTGCIIMMGGVVLQSIGHNFGMLVASRFFIGFGVAIAHGASPLLLTELVHPQHRAIYTTIYNCTWYFGSIIAAWTTYGTDKMSQDNDWAWRIPTMIQAVPSALQLFFIWFVPESPRFLIARGKEEQALTVLANAHGGGNKEDELVQVEYKEIQQTLKLEQEFSSTKWSELWATKGNRHRLVILISLGFFSQWSGNGLVSYYMTDVLKLAGITNSQTQLEINGILMIVNFIVALSFCFIIERAGRRPLFLTATAGMCASYIVWTAMAATVEKSSDRDADGAVIPGSGNTKAAHTEIAFIFIYYCFYNMAWSGLLVGYAVEILPYNIRAKGMNVMWLCVDLSLFFNQYVNPVALAGIQWKYYIVYAVWLAFETLVVWKFYIETKGTPLEEIVKHFDGENAVLGGTNATEKGRQLAAEIDMHTDSGLEGTTSRSGHIDEKQQTIETEVRADNSPK